LREIYPEVKALGAEVVVIGPDGAAAFDRHFAAHRLPFIGVPDPRRVVRSALGQGHRLLIGPMPDQLVAGRDGRLAAVHRGTSMRDLPDPQGLLSLLRRLAPRPEPPAPPEDG
jgi:peroxiredoxin